MNNLQFFPFERNQYYYGKLMTYQDMTSEQKYMNDKRRLINRFLHGVGVVSGLQVVRMDEKTLSVEAGIALDDTGREIVIEEPRVLMLAQTEGYEDLMAREDLSSAYLCLGYREEGVCPARTMAGGNGRAEAFEKCREGSRLYLSAVRTGDDRDTLLSLTSQTVILFENNDLVITRRMPSFVRSAASFETVLRIEAKHELDDVTVSVASSLSAISQDGTESMEESWSGSFRSAGDAAELKKTCTAYSVEHAYGIIATRRRNLRVTAAGREYYPAADATSRILISTEDTYHQMMESWYQGSMNRFLSGGGMRGIYLARLYLKRTGDDVSIERVDQLPFDQRVYNAFVNTGLTEQLIRDVDALKAQVTGTRSSDARRKPEEYPQKIATGVFEFDVGLGGKAGERFFSGEIVHGLGLGRLRINLSLDSEESQYFGSAEIFEDMNVRAELAAKANSERGSFVIGIRFLEATSVRSIRIRWTAELLQEKDEGSAKQYIRVLPDKPEMKCMQSRYFRAETENMHKATILWEVLSPKGGTITRDGMYTAPDVEGIYEIRAFCQEDPRVMSSVYVIVRE
ncbi:MAG: hypothetical protein K6E83_10405 [Clostridium sp.]|nr:hypothetical protein [Clostridium sp.]